MASLAQAIRMALHYGEENLEVTDIFGEDVGPPLGGAFTVTQGLKTAWNCPLDERGIIGMATGIGLAGKRCVAEIQFADYIFNTIDLLKLAGNASWTSKGEFNCPIVVMTPTGSGIHGSVYHSHSFDAWASRLTGWKVVIPSTPLDAYGLMLSAIEDPNPVLYLIPKALMRAKGEEKIPGEPEEEKELRQRIDQPVDPKVLATWKPRWPDTTDYKVPIGKAKHLLQGNHATVVSYGRQMPIVHQIALKMREEGMEYDVFDLRTIYPYDWEALKESIQRTGRVLFVNEDTEISNFGEHLLRRTCDELFYSLKVRPRLLAGKHIPGIGIAPILEDVSVPQAIHIEKEMRELIQEPA
ncbi:MAG: alpha-ketoacid dehydrogenase subunit beta [Proteobacteria bacterium]|nr:MAG: alpha-ketoacid dehydrogenase subunit beta [Pseudomonadota bacterium]RZA08687.1 MAG: alpha-ketoacid dehydrogenase subunit beta [Pseudomonadota bacterium]